MKISNLYLGGMAMKPIQNKVIITLFKKKY